MFEINSVLDTDSYKFGHYLMLPQNVRYISSYGEARSDQVFQRSMFFGLQAWLKGLKPITMYDVEEANELAMEHCGVFPLEGMKRIVEVHNGVLPLEIQALPEGLVVPNRTALYQVRNLDPELPWLTQYVEAALLRAVWYPSTVATLSWHMKQDLRAFLEETCDNPEQELLFRLHDFGARGTSSVESAALGGMAHLVNFRGSDTLPGLMAARRFYGEKLAAYNIPAMEHSTVCAWGEDGEVDALRNAIRRVMKPGVMLSGLLDTYDLHKCTDEIIGKELKQEILDSGGRFVGRPDSGDPVAESRYVLRSLANAFGTERNRKGYDVLHPAVRVIYGDSINRDSMSAILTAAKMDNLSAENITFGMGGGLLQSVNRDTLGYAQKASAITSGHTGWIGIAKNPVTARQKVSKKGRLAVVCEDGSYRTILESDLNGHENLLQTVWNMGTLVRDMKFAEVRANSELTVSEMLAV